jgi:hypothetical protein
MKALILISLTICFQVSAAEWGSTLESLAQSGLAKSHYDAYEFKQTNRPSPDDATVRAYQEMERSQALRQQANQQQRCYFDQYQRMVCN